MWLPHRDLNANAGVVQEMLLLTFSSVFFSTRNQVTRKSTLTSPLTELHKKLHGLCLILREGFGWSSPQCKPAFLRFAWQNSLFCYLNAPIFPVFGKQSPSSQLFTIYAFSFDQKPLLYFILFYLCYFKRCLSSY